MNEYIKKPQSVSAIQFNGLDSYLEIVEWMKREGDTHALANEVEYRTPIMIMTTHSGAHALRVGDYVIKDIDGVFPLLE